MTTYVRPAAVALDDADIIVGWNISPNVGYTVQLIVMSTTVVALLYDAAGTDLLASGVCTVGADQPIMLVPYMGGVVGMHDAGLGWHLLVTTEGTEGERTIRIESMVDLTARTHPVYADDDLALAVATAEIDAGTHYMRDITVVCPAGTTAALGDISSASIDGTALVGQVTSISRSGDANSTSATFVIREQTQIRPDVYVAPVVIPSVSNVSVVTDGTTIISGNVLDDAYTAMGSLFISSVNGLPDNVGVPISGSAGGIFVVSIDGSYVFDPGGSGAGYTSVTVDISNGYGAANAIITVQIVPVAYLMIDGIPATIDGSYIYIG